MFLLSDRWNSLAYVSCHLPLLKNNGHFERHDISTFACLHNIEHFTHLPKNIRLEFPGKCFVQPLLSCGFFLRVAVYCLDDEDLLQRTLSFDVVCKFLCNVNDIIENVWIHDSRICYSSGKEWRVLLAYMQQKSFIVLCFISKKTFYLSDVFTVDLQKKERCYKTYEWNL